jgi:hypothetical protein
MVFLADLTILLVLVTICLISFKVPFKKLESSSEWSLSMKILNILCSRLERLLILKVQTEGLYWVAM